MKPRKHIYINHAKKNHTQRMFSYGKGKHHNVSLSYLTVCALDGSVRGITDKYDVARQFVELGLGESVVLDDYAGQSACDIQNEFIEILQRDYPHFFSPTL